MLPSYYFIDRKAGQDVSGFVIIKHGLMVGAEQPPRETKVQKQLLQL